MKFSYHRHSRQQGLTLIEVLIASVILFMAIGLAATIFQQNLLLQRKVLDQVEQTKLTQVVTRKILFELEHKVTSGKITAFGYDVDWKAQIESSAAFVDSYNFESEKYSEGVGTINVYQVTVESEQWPNWVTVYKEAIWQH